MILFLVTLIILMSFSCQEASNTYDPLVLECGKAESLEANLRPVLNPSFKKIEEPDLEVFIKELQGWKLQKNVFSSRSCLQINPEHTYFIRTKNKSLGQIFDGSRDSSEAIVLEPIIFPPLNNLCPEALYSSDKQVRLDFFQNQLTPSKFSELRRLTVEISSGQKKIYGWDLVDLAQLGSLQLPDNVLLQQGEYDLTIIENNYLQDIFGLKNTCKLRIDSSELDVMVSNLIQDVRTINGQDVAYVDTNYALDFLVPSGFRDVEVEYCVTEISYDQIRDFANNDEISPCIEANSFRSGAVTILDKGFFDLKYLAKKGNIQTNWKRTIIGIRSLCTGSIRSDGITIRMLDPRMDYCTDLNGKIDLILGKSVEDNVYEELKYISKLNGNGAIQGDVGQGRELSLVTVNGNFRITNSSLTNLDFLNGLNEVNGRLEIINNDNLLNMAGLSSLRQVSILRVYDNDSLTKIEFPRLRRALELDIKSKTDSIVDLPILEASSLILVENEGPSSSLIFKDLNELEFLDRLDIRAEVIEMLPGVPQMTKIESISLSISGEPEITDWNFEEIESLFIGGHVTPRTLTKLTAPIKTIGQSLALKGITGISDLSHLSHIDLAEGADVKLYEMPNIMSISGLRWPQNMGQLRLSGLNIVNLVVDIGVNTMGSLWVLDNPKLETISGFKGLTTVSGAIYSEGNDILSSLAGFEDLESVGRLILANSSSRSLHIQGLQNLKFIGRDFVSYSPLDEASGLVLPNLEGIEGRVLIKVDGDCAPSQLRPRFKQLLAADFDLSPVVYGGEPEFRNLYREVFGDDVYSRSNPIFFNGSMDLENCPDQDS
ncbi:hypothetical protein [Pseudobacteriovorax antillogorgiicola]|uniref:Receptor L domain-containing protein n=1 Tax=Pseudobacteriovorax antillogorgiicola TaxID=1513793 RepID=A0A1Y6CQX7_9BACT|nr:hypothetical protein [Pseudobacteriovorax antillogorgiicola]TCS42731.1 hypothetical protein EDD56_14118 [Pseudobacteriovorax antillogorgiicola]SMF82374.1 hypothetical protein SAMN06296036_1412 [Pseudobacteriovorax antillogorgiicola]